MLYQVKATQGSKTGLVARTKGAHRVRNGTVAILEAGKLERSRTYADRHYIHTMTHAEATTLLEEARELFAGYPAHTLEIVPAFRRAKPTPPAGV